MKTNKKLMQTTLLATLLGGALALSSGCGKSSEPTTPPEQPAPDAAGEAVSSMVDAAKPVAEETVKQAKEVANAAVADATAKANGLIDQAKTLISETKYADAMKTVQQLSSLKLTPEQEKIVAGLKEQIQKAMAAVSTGEGAAAAGNLLNK